MKTLFIIDIDGTIAHAGRRFAEAGTEPTRHYKDVYEAWVARVQNEHSLMQDEPVAGMRTLCRALEHYPYSDTVFLTSREERWRKITNEWIKENGFPFTIKLVMRGDGNYSEGADFKEGAIDILMQAYRSTEVVVVDDDGQGTIEEMCKRRGWTFLKARSGGQE